uniref:Peroxisome biogenesis protein 12 n=1 Tax=Auxenochlorella protothecoides TaxID=3075 RepID=A0A1D1ZTV3_AUXPR
MSFVTVGGEASSRPTFFELVAADRLLPSLKAAITYSLSVYAQRRPSLLRLLDHEDELFFLISAWLHRGSLRASDASFAEGLYALRRVPAARRGAEEGAGGLSPQQRISTLALLTLVPYARAKLDGLHGRHAPQLRSLQALGLQPPPAPAARGADGLADGWRRLALRAFLRGYPCVVAVHEGSRFLYQLLYLLGRSPHYAPGLHLLGLTVARVDPRTQAARGRELAARRAARAARGASLAWPLRLARGAALRAGYAVADHTHNALILAVFAFKLLEWWYTSGEQALGERAALTPPPPPPPLAPAEGGIQLPDDAALCPLCRSERKNPALLAPTGYAFCYTCVHRHVSEAGACPVTLEPVKLEDIWRLYPGM